jgi:hypothetical protein
MDNAQPVKYQGIWWFPDKPDVKFFGDLVFDETKLLELVIVTYSEVDQGYIESVNETDIICGHTVENEQITLLYCWRAGTRSNNLGVNTIPFRAELLLVGYCYPTANIEFASLLVTFSNLTNWLQLDYPFENEGYETDEHTIEKIKYSRVEDITIHVRPLACHLTLGLMLLRSSSNTASTASLTLRQQGFFCIKPEIPQSISWFLQIVTELRHLLSLLLGFPSHVVTLSAEHGAPFTSVTIYGVQLPSEFNNSLGNEFMLLSHAHLGNHTSTVIGNWFSKKEVLETLSYLALGVLLRRHHIFEFEFLALVQALEGYHKVTYPNCKKVTSNDKTTECSLQKRLTDLYKNLPSEVKAQIGKGDIDNYFQSIANTRNFLSHRAKKPTAQILEGKALREAVNHLATFVTAVIFIELDVPTNLIHEALLRGKVSGVREMWWR